MREKLKHIFRAKGNCKICYAAVALTDFSVSGGGEKKFVTKSCCSYGKYFFAVMDDSDDGFGGSSLLSRRAPLVYDPDVSNYLN